MNINKDYIERIKELLNEKESADQAINLIHSLMKGEDFLREAGFEIEWNDIPTGIYTFPETDIESKVLEFQMSRSVITNSQWHTLFGGGVCEEEKNLPKTNISWKEASCFCKIISRILEINVSLPHEIEWAYAAKGGNNFTYSGSNNFREIAFTDMKKKYRIEQKIPNSFGLFDMSGNVWEFCSNTFYCNEDRETPASSKKKISLRGGSCLSPERCSEIKYRFCLEGTERREDAGFRITRRYSSSEGKVL